MFNFTQCLDKAPEDPISAGNLIYAYRKMGNIQESVNFGNKWKTKYQSNDYFEEQLEISINQLSELNKAKEEESKKKTLLGWLFR